MQPLHNLLKINWSFLFQYVSLWVKNTTSYPLYAIRNQLFIESNGISRGNFVTCGQTSVSQNSVPSQLVKVQFGNLPTEVKPTFTCTINSRPNSSIISIRMISEKESKTIYGTCRFNVPLCNARWLASPYPKTCSSIAMNSLFGFAGMPALQFSERRSIQPASHSEIV